jgi:hypothetical protein
MGRKQGGVHNGGKHNRFCNRCVPRHVATTPPGFENAPPWAMEISFILWLSW